MQRYELDEYVQEPVEDYSVCANCVASWHARLAADGHVESLFVDLHNSWFLDSSSWSGPPDVPGRILRALQTNERGRVGNNPTEGNGRNTP